MAGAILFACGGAAKHVLEQGSGIIGMPVESLDLDGSNTVPLIRGDLPDRHLEQSAAYALAYDSRQEIKSIMTGRRIVFAFAMLGGGTATGVLPILSQCAHDVGCEFVTILGLPFESGRREMSMEYLNEAVSVSDRAFLADTVSLTRLYPDMVMHRAMNMMATSLQFAMNALATLADGPFFSTFTRKVYTIAYTSALYPSDAVARAAEASMFDVDPSYGKSVVMVSSGFGSAQIESIFNTVASMTGIIPDIVKRDDFEDTKVLTFIPVQGL